MCLNLTLNSVFVCVIFYMIVLECWFSQDRDFVFFVCNCVPKVSEIVQDA